VFIHDADSEMNGLPRSDKQPIVLATAQSVITPDVRANGAEIRRLMEIARAQGADIVHFPEAAMSGYTKSQIKSWDDVDWKALEAELEQTARLAAGLGLWAVIGCAHRLTAPNRPHNSLYIISARGAVVTRYDKQWCSHTEITRFFSPGQGLGVFEVGGWRFGCALCIEIQFPELFQAYRARDVDCMQARRNGGSRFITRDHGARKPGKGPSTVHCTSMIRGVTTSRISSPPMSSTHSAGPIQEDR
jgi:apolipoprotein N-acyltransferase